MLNTLKEIGYNDALGVLSELTRTFVPQSVVEDKEIFARAVDFRHENVLTEIRASLDLAPNDNSDEARDKIINFISDQISQIVLGGVDEKVVKTRLGNKGALRPDLYEIDYGPEFKNIQDRGIRREHVGQALNYPDDVEHVLPEQPFEKNGSYSLYVKHRIDPDPYKCFTLLVISSRNGYKQSVMDAMRIYPTDVDISSARNPLDLLRAFLGKYGQQITVGKQTSKFFFLAIIEKPVVIQEYELLHIAAFPEGHKGYGLMQFRDTGPTIEVAMAYATNDTIYRKDLKKHGVQVKL